jgi:nucleotide-binding universal stress UspA family protein
MAIGRIMVPVSGPRLLESKLDHALALATRFGSRVDVLFLHGSVDPLTIDSNPFLGNAREIAEINWSQDESARLDVETRLDHWSRARGVPYREAIANPAGPRLLFLEIKSDWAQALQDHGRTSDLIVIGQPGREMTAMEVAINKLSVMASGRSVLTVPNDPPPAENILAHILIAWDGGLQASRTVALAMPLLKAAQQRTVYTSGDADGARSRLERMQDYLACNGLTAESVVDDDASRWIGGRLIDAAERQRATLICMGAYENSRAAELIIGGNTRHLYSRSGIPVLFSY